ncbi:transcriptional regulator [Acuticoccus sediminis]|uniref:Transcriptional regulator n=1 Tax=Acuticoccus sediminis TaxID=2184697 RepID=A0A8B2NNB1_9HYPH|nr:helix-turn-helix domain-containing protein [Acuticoccus sediminis]RAH95795.1 transcriptional regulator [Acuticoccus sediminis]
MDQTLIRTPRQLGATIQRRRKALGLTQTDLAGTVGLGQATISEIERGEGARLESLMRIVVALDFELMVRPRTRMDTDEIGEIF